jgi:hypothetical protein
MPAYLQKMCNITRIVSPFNFTQAIMDEIGVQEFNALQPDGVHFNVPVNLIKALMVLKEIIHFDELIPNAFAKMLYNCSEGSSCMSTINKEATKNSVPPGCGEEYKKVRPFGNNLPQRPLQG